MKLLVVFMHEVASIPIDNNDNCQMGQRLLSIICKSKKAKKCMGI